MAAFIQKPTIVEAAGQPPKSIEEFIGRVNSGTAAVSIARMRSPGGWSEPGKPRNSTNTRSSFEAACTSS